MTFKNFILNEKKQKKINIKLFTYDIVSQPSFKAIMNSKTQSLNE